MRNLIFSLILALPFAGCATVRDPSSVLYQQYAQYENTTSKDNIIEVARYFFSPSLLGGDYQTNPDAINQLLFKHYMVTKDSHHEKVNGHDGCLTINGYDEEDTPLILSLKYISSDNHWLIDKIHVVYIDNAKEFASSAKCPTEYPK